MLLILADDLTGALDTGIQFAKHKIPTGVLVSAGAQLNRASAPEVLVINTNTRHCSPAGARTIIAACARQKAAYVYKKTDSTLRGHIGAELEALMDARNTLKLPFVPAYPALGRTTKEGRQYLRGKPIDETEMAADPLNPVKTSFIPDIIGEESAVPVRHVAQGEEISDETGGREIFIFDGETEEDLRKIAKGLYEKNLLGESAGCAGFAEVLMEVLPLKKEKVSEPGSGFVPKNQISRQMPILVVSGSLHPVSMEQVKAALDDGISGFAAAGDKLLRPDWFQSEEAKTLASSCAQSLKGSGICILGTEMSLGKTPVFEPLPKDSFTENISGRLGELARMIAKETGPLVLAVFGGDTLLGIMEGMGYIYLKPLEEISPGVVLSIAEGQEGRIAIITKAGAFGDAKIIRSIIESIRRNHVYS